jgi:capsular exopolysaccharide synthesis family protein
VVSGVIETLRWVRSDLLVALSDRSGLAGEQFRKMSIRLEALKETLGGTMQAVMVTSPMMGDGKTATAANLALTLARDDSRRVALVDCDVRKPRIGALFQAPPATGLADALLAGAPVERIAVPTDRPSLHVVALPRGSDGRLDPLPVDRLRGVLRTLRERYDFIVCDAPPVLPIADTAAIGRLVDGIVLVVRAGRTPRHAVARTLESIDRKKLIGFVLNDVAERSLDRYYYRYHADDVNGGRPGRR